MMSSLPRSTHAPNSSTSIICKNISKQVNINIYNQIGGRNERQKLKRVFFSRDGMIKRRPKWENKRDHKRQERCECVCVRQRNWCGNYHAFVAGSSKLKKKKKERRKVKRVKAGGTPIPYSLPFSVHVVFLFEGDHDTRFVTCHGLTPSNPKQ